MSGLDAGPLSDHLQRGVPGIHAKLERQGSKGSKCSTPPHKVHSPLANMDKQSSDLHGLLSIVGSNNTIRLLTNHDTAMYSHSLDYQKPCTNVDLDL